jgi:hypothetical protein
LHIATAEAAAETEVDTILAMLREVLTAISNNRVETSPERE